MKINKNNNAPSNWLWLLPILMLYSKKGSNKLNIYHIDNGSIEKKARLLNRIKGYMHPEEQLIIHRAEMLLHIISKVKLMMEAPDMLNSTTYSSLSIEDKKKNMLLDISEYVDTDKQDLIYSSLEIHSKLNHVSNKLKEIQSLNAQSITIESVEKYIELFEPILDGQAEGKTKELKAIVGILKLVKLLEEKGKLDETDLLEIIKPFIGDEQKEQLTKMLQLVKVFSALNETNNEKPELMNEENKVNNDKEESKGKNNEDNNHMKEGMGKKSHELGEKAYPQNNLAMPKEDSN